MIEQEETLEDIQREVKNAEEQEFYDNLEENIYTLRMEIQGQAKLLKELGMIPNFCDRVLELEKLQRAWDAWEESEEL